MDGVWDLVVKGLGLDLTRDMSAPIPATSFRRIADYEARNACKIDSSEDLPAILRTKGLFPLPIENGTYQLVRGQGFHRFEPIGTPVQAFDSKLDHELTTASGIGESVFIHYAYNTGLLSDFIKVDDLWKTNEGRFYASEFSFMVGKVGPIHQKSTQIQIDGLFEGRDSIVIIEAKTKEHTDFIIRQLYYPYRHWEINSKKEVRSLFLSVDLDTKVYSFWQYRFARPDDYGSIELERSARFVIKEHPRNAEELDFVPSDPELLDIPQADNVETICSVPLLVNSGFDASDTLAARVGFAVRQALYYTEAAEQLGLVERRREGGARLRFRLTDLGTRVVMSRPDRRHEMVAREMMRLPIMRAVLDELKERADAEDDIGRGLTRADIVKMILMSSRLNKTTAKRRAGTVIAWFSWMSSHYGVVQFKDGLLTIHKDEQRRLDAF